MSTLNLIRVMLVDDHHLIRAGIRQLLESAPNIRIVAEAECGEQAIEKVRATPNQIDIAVVDVEMPGMSAQQLIQLLLQQNPPVRSVVLTGSGDESFPSKLLTNGAYSYVTKSCDSQHVVKAIEKAMRNERYLSPDVAKKLAFKVLHHSVDAGSSEESPFDRLSVREKQCLLLLVQEQGIKEIAQSLDINPKTINTYRYRIFQKLNLNSDVELIRLAVRYKLIDKKE